MALTKKWLRELEEKVIRVACLEHFRDRLKQGPPTSAYWVAFSGGLDSTVLLHLMHRIRESLAIELRAVHVHHGLLAEADAWVRHCTSVARSYGVPLEILRVDAVAKPGESPEAAARTARYRALQESLPAGAVLLTAHHQDDQAETLLLQLLRGTGIAGLAAMAEVAPLGKGSLFRPLLCFGRSTLRKYAISECLRWVEDPSNTDERHDRNFVRRRLLPLLATHWPAATANLTRTARNCAEVISLVETIADEILARAMNPEVPRILEIDPIRAFSPERQRVAIRAWIRRNGLRVPTSATLERIRRESVEAPPDRMPLIQWSEGVVRRYRTRLYLLPRKRDFDPNTVLHWDGTMPLKLPHVNGALTASMEKGAGIDPIRWQCAKITVRYRLGGETIRLVGHSHHRKLKKLLQEAGIPPWERDRIPIIYLDGKIAAIAGNRWISSDLMGNPLDTNVVVRWLPPPCLRDWFSEAAFTASNFEGQRPGSLPEAESD
jgi:tRNA(Ile)-lysidine synthase